MTGTLLDSPHRVDDKRMVVTVVDRTSRLRAITHHSRPPVWAPKYGQPPMAFGWTTIRGHPIDTTGHRGID
ncbi:hypothetical protein BOX37_31720 [Nocardia mangyaensis]|uniref:Uncharacterized protein n=1 Tax=Nocardia mangyaensis TaxID=2213200 RepID=A0A1J0W0N5_9NOCA|nr:hypothetical protein BOX37_31720 [Nocardia mangyaensis]